MLVSESVFPEVALLFWNVQKKDVKHNVVRLAQGHGINILVVAEFDKDQDDGAWIMALNEPPRLPGENEFHLVSPVEKPRVGTAMAHVRIFTRLPLTAWRLCTMHNRYAVWTITLPNRCPFTLAITHFPAIQQDQGDQQREVAIALRQDIEKSETNLQQADPSDPLFSIVIGDFNANPFDAGIAAVYGLNATHLKATALGGPRKANGREHPYFFNPMWRFLGVEPWGSYFDNALANPIRFDWFLLDQVLVRPDVIRFFDLHEEPDVQILTSDGIVEFDLMLPKKQSDGNVYSDRLPLYFRCDLPEKAREALRLEQENTDE